MKSLPARGTEGRTVASPSYVPSGLALYHSFRFPLRLQVFPVVNVHDLTFLLLPLYTVDTVGDIIHHSVRYPLQLLILLPDIYLSSPCSSMGELPIPTPSASREFGPPAYPLLFTDNRVVPSVGLAARRHQNLRSSWLELRTLAGRTVSAPRTICSV